MSQTPKPKKKPDKETIRKILEAHEECMKWYGLSDNYHVCMDIFYQREGINRDELDLDEWTIIKYKYGLNDP